MATTYPPTSTAASTALGYVLDALGAEHGQDHLPVPGLPDGRHVIERDMLLVVTDKAAPHGRVAVQLAATERRLNVVLLRLTQDDDGAIAVDIDLMLAALPHAPWSFDGLSLWAGPAGDLWLVPDGFGPAIEVTCEGLNLDLMPPYAEMGRVLCQLLE